MKHTPLYERHLQTASKVINLKNFARPLQYVGHLQEHRAVREGVSLADVSHMGEIDFRGKNALDLVQKLITNDARRLAPNQALYSVMCHPEGGIIDDLVCFRLAEDHFLWVVNVTKTDEDYQWILKQAREMDVAVRNLSSETALLALQGPHAREVLQKVTPADLSSLPYYHLVETVIHTEEAEVPCLVSRTGYTGEMGYEILVARELAPALWDELLQAGRPLGIVPHGVAARESLRIEAGYLLNGNDMDGRTNPFEVNLGWVVKFSKDFIGREALRKIREEGIIRKLVGLQVPGPNILRYGYPIYGRGREIGRVTSGQFSHFGFGFVPIGDSEVGSELEIGIRGRRCPAQVVPVPFCRRRVKEEPAVHTFSPFDLRFAGPHLWLRPAGEGSFVLGLTDFGQRELGDILAVEFGEIGKPMAKGSTVCRVDSYRKALELQTPLAGEITGVNGAVWEDPGQVNRYPYERSGLLKFKAADPGDYDHLSSYSEYLADLRPYQRYDHWSKEKRTTC